MNIEDLNISLKAKEQEFGVVHQCTFSLDQGKVLGLIGESGCGKSMTCLALMGLLDGNQWNISGRITLKGQGISCSEQESLRRIRGKDVSIIMQNPIGSFNPLFTIGEHFVETICSHNKVSRKEARETAIEMLSKTNIKEPERVMSQYPFQLSGGMLQRVMIAIALHTCPSVLIADEPTTSLDVTVQHQILSELWFLREEYDTAIMLVSHDLGVIAQMADAVAVMYAGYLVEKASAEEIFHNPLHPYTKALMQSKPAFTKQRLKALEGYPPAITEVFSGCPFYNRCPVKQTKCLDYDMRSFGRRKIHTVKCLLCAAEDRVYNNE